VSEEKNPHLYSSPACLLHELEELPQNWEEIKAWRKLRRRERIMQRLGREPSERRRLDRIIVCRLIACLERSSYPVLGIYSPIRGEVDVREIAHRHIAAGGQVALPVVVKKAAPVEFWRWSPDMRMQQGLWNIPIPWEREVVNPEALLIPMVGFDRARYRLGYGGGYYDRTLAAAATRPHTIGVAYADSELPTIQPQSHDIPMKLIVTDRFTVADT
jgi:5-formyltetrahydrofolate cyclo-ligase